MPPASRGSKCFNPSSYIVRLLQEIFCVSILDLLTNLFLLITFYFVEIAIPRQPQPSQLQRLRLVILQTKLRIIIIYAMKITVVDLVKKNPGEKNQSCQRLRQCVF